MILIIVDLLTGMSLKVLIKQSFIENNLDFDEFQLEVLVDEFLRKLIKIIVTL